MVRVQLLTLQLMSYVFPGNVIVLGQFDGGLLAGGQESEWKGELPDAPNSLGSFALWDGTSAWPSIWKLAPDILPSRSLNLAAIDMKLVALN